MNDLNAKSITELAELIRTRHASPVEIVQAHLDRISQINPALNAVVTIAPDLIEQARKAEVAIMSGGVVGPLHGVPLTVKDTIETAGLRTTSGSLMRAEFVPNRDAQSVVRLKGAGAIIIGKTNPAEMAMDYTADNPVFGRTNNPHNPLLTPGGSSGGEAAAIATCMSAGGLGTDLAGSIRIPSHFCGVAGLKPTVGRVPGDGQFPPSAGPYSLGAVIGPMARNVADLKLLFAALARLESKGDAPLDRQRGSRVAFYTDDGVSPVTEETRRAVETAARALSDAGFVTEEVRPPGVERGHDLWLKLFSRASVVQLRNVYQEHEALGGDFVRWRLATADDTPPPSLDDYIKFWLERDRLRETLINWMNDTPLLIAPVGATPAYEHGTLKVRVGEQTMSTFRAFSYCQTFNVFDLPAVVIPIATSNDGLPIGVQFVGRPFAEAAILDAAAIVEAAVGGWQPPSGYTR